MTWDAGAGAAGHRRAARSRAWSCGSPTTARCIVPGRQRVPRLPRRSRAHRRGARRRRLAPHRRHRRARRRGLPAHRRPQEGAHHHRGRQERLAGQPRGGAEGAAAHRPGVRRRRRRALHRRAARARPRRRARVGGEPRRRPATTLAELAERPGGAGRDRARGRRAPTSASRTPSRSASARVLPDEWLPDTEELTPDDEAQAARHRGEVRARDRGALRR